MPTTLHAGIPFVGRFSTLARRGGHVLGTALLALSGACAGAARPEVDVAAPARETACAEAPPAKPEAASPPNFLFILVDDQSWNGTSVAMEEGNGSSRQDALRTPNLERLAARGVTFSQAYAAHPKCECSRAAIITGRTTVSLRCVEKSMTAWAAPASDSLANSLKRLEPAYRAAHFGKWQWRNTPASLGFDLSDGITQNETGDSPDPLDPKRSFSLTRRASEFLKSAVADRAPFFLQLSYYAPHAKAQALASTVANYAQGGRNGAASVFPAMVEDLDGCIGTVLQQLDELGIADRTFVIYMSDNGGQTRFLQGGKATLWEGGIRVPLIVAGPGVPHGARSSVPVVSYDILPTVLDFASPRGLAAVPKGVEGGSWRAVLAAARPPSTASPTSAAATPRAGDSEARETRPVVARPIDFLMWHMPVEIEHPQSAIRQGPWKLLYEWDTKVARLYDIDSDPREARDLSAEHPERTKAMLATLKAHAQAGLGEPAVAALERGEKAPARGGRRNDGAAPDARKGASRPSKQDS
jgi:arylsulfatase A-like enzyme